MKYIKTFEQKISLSDIPNIGIIRNKKYLKIIEYYLCFDNRYVELNIPVDIYYGHNVFYEETQYDNRHFYEIKGMWANFKDDIQSHNYNDPRFLINMLSEEVEENNVPDWSEYEERLIIRDEENNKIIIDILYDYVMNHQEIIQASKFNI